MTEQIIKTSRLASAVAVSAVLLAAGCATQSKTKAPVDYRGTTPGGTTAATPPPSTTGATTSGIVTNGTDRYVVAQDGDTVETLAKRHGLSGSELAGYNGLTPGSQLVVGQDLVVPPGAVTNTPRVADAGAGATTGAGTPTWNNANTDGRVEAVPLPGTGGAPVAADGTIATDATIPDPTAGATTGAGATDTTGGGSTTGWSPDLAAAAIARSGETPAGGDATGLKEDGRLGAPPSSKEPVPTAPTAAGNLDSPGLGQYQTNASSGDPAKRPAPTGEVAAVDTTRTDAGAPKVKLQRPVSGPIAVGFGQGAGATKNDGVDFAAPAGAEVVAADDGEVALVSETLGGLGTIVLVRHKNELLTVYGRVDGVKVKKGDIVRRGQPIGVVSNAAAPAEPRMHFEVRKGATVLDPMGFL